MTVQDPSAERDLPSGASGAGPAQAPGGRVSPWNIANGLTALRIALVPLFGWLLLGTGDDRSWRIAAAVTFAVATVTDRLDGELARRWSLVTDLGKIADPIADKALMGTALVGLSVLGELPWWVTAVVLVRELGITLMRLLVVRYVVLPAGRGGKIKMALQAAAVTLYLLPLGATGHLVAVATMTVAVILTVLTGVDYVWSTVASLRNGPAAVARRTA
jgi:CDP-diacylglycerol--glycerol-3-phosphate 3-phosphatidyltransferase